MFQRNGESETHEIFTDVRRGRGLFLVLVVTWTGSRSI